MKTTFTKTVCLFAFLLIGNTALFAQHVAINATATLGDASAALDVASSNKGLLMPRVALTSATDVTTIPSPATSLLVYNTATSGTVPNDVIPGYYYWNGSQWTALRNQTSTAGALAFADFYALMPPDNAATVPPGGSVQFPQDGPSSGGITRISSSTFNLADIGTYMVNWQVSINEPGQLVLVLNGSELLSTVVGRATGTTQITGSRLITTTIPNSTLSVNNPVTMFLAYSLTPFAGGTNPASASLVITRLQ